MKIKTLGIFDSGLGGYSVYDYLKENGPVIQYILYADQKNAPYGNQSKEAITNHVRNALLWFQAEGIATVLLACNTASAVALPTLRLEFPEMNIVGIIDLTLQQIKNKTSQLAIVSTKATMESHAYKETWGSDSIEEYALPDLVSLIENGCVGSQVRAYLSAVSSTIKPADYLVLACTHFPLVKDEFQQSFDMEIVDSRKPILEYVVSIAEHSLEDSKIYTTGDSEKMMKQIKKLFNKNEEVSEL